MQRESERKEAPESNQKKPWETPKLSYVGDVQDVIQGGEGKISTNEGDPGELKKQRPTG